MSFSHTNYKSEQIYTVTYNYIFHENVSNVNPFSVGRHFNLTRLVWVKANKLFLFDFATVMLQQERCWVSKKMGIISSLFLNQFYQDLTTPNAAYTFSNISNPGN